MMSQDDPASAGPSMDSGARAEVEQQQQARRGSRLSGTPASTVEVPAGALRFRTRRDFLIFGVGAVAAAAGFWWLLPEDSQQRWLPAGLRSSLDSIEARSGISAEHSAALKDRVLKRALTFDDDVAEALYSPTRSVPTYGLSDGVGQLRNNYNGETPDPEYLKDWELEVVGSTRGKDLFLNLDDINALERQYGQHEQVTRLVCVEGWSAVAWWAGLRFNDFLKAYPPRPTARWIRIDSDVNLDGDGNPDPYYVSIDLPTAQHPQTLLATKHRDAKLTVEHGAPVRLVAPMKLGLKNIKAITKITYTDHEPADYWNERGYSKYDGI